MPVSLLYTRSRQVSSAGIRLVTWGDFSHVAQIDGPKIIESVFRDGVREDSLDNAIARASHWAIVEYEHYNPAGMIAAVRSQIGKPYDKTGALGLGLHRDWQEDDAWWCSELIPWAAQQADDPWFMPAAQHRITPQHLWMRYGRIVGTGAHQNNPIAF